MFPDRNVEPSMALRKDGRTARIRCEWALSTRELGSCLVLLLVTSFFACATYLRVRARHEAARRLSDPVSIAIHPELLMERNGRPLYEKKRPYVLVEFGDYQCPPCRYAAAYVLPGVLRRHYRDVALVFRNLPLQGLHPRALQAATFAEAARCQGKFEAVHTALFRSNLTPGDMRRVALGSGMDMKRLRSDAVATAYQAVRGDERLADQLGIHATPTFLLCCPNGRVLRLQGLAQLEAVMPSDARGSAGELGWMH